MISASLERLHDWCAHRPDLRLVLGAPLVDGQIDALPQLIADRNPGLPVPFDAGDFPIPPSYRDFLRTCSSARVEYRIEGRWEVYEPVNVFGPDEVAAGHSFVDGSSLDDREIQTTFLVAFVTAGCEVEASRWCFYTGDDGDRREEELPILLESNDFECDLAKYVDTGEWVPGAFTTAAAVSFGVWLDRLVTLVTTRPFTAIRRDDAVANAFYS